MNAPFYARGEGSGGAASGLVLVDKSRATEVAEVADVGYESVVLEVWGLVVSRGSWNVVGDLDVGLNGKWPEAHGDGSGVEKGSGVFVDVTTAALFRDTVHLLMVGR